MSANINTMHFLTRFRWPFDAERKRMNLIVVTAKNWAIGKDNDLLFSLPEDMKYFRQVSRGKTVVMGRKTLESFPGAKPLPNRRNLVLTRNSAYEKEGAAICHSEEELLSRLADTPEEEILIIGGGEIYARFLDRCHLAYVTRVETPVPDADQFFPDLSLRQEWKLLSQSEEKEQNGHRFRFCIYENQNPAQWKTLDKR